MDALGVHVIVGEKENFNTFREKETSAFRRRGKKRSRNRKAFQSEALTSFPMDFDWSVRIEKYFRNRLGNDKKGF